jgi:hypothetical protein
VKFSTAFQGPIVVQIGEETLSIPVLTMDFFIQWGAQIDAEARDAYLATVPEKDRNRTAALFRVQSTDLNELIQRTYAPAGALHVVTAALAAAGKSAEAAAALARRLRPDDLLTLALVVTGIRDLPEVTGNGQQQGGTPDPLTGAAAGSGGS